MKNNLQYRKSIRVHKRKSTPLDRYAQPQSVKPIQQDLDKVVFEEASFQAVYKKITKEMHINILPDRRVRRDKRPGEEIKRVDTEQLEEKKQRVYYSVERARNHIKIINQTSFKANNRTSQSVTRSLHKIRKSQDDARLKVTLLKPQQPLKEFVAVTSELVQNFPHMQSIINHYLLFEDILMKLKHAETGASVLESVRNYVLEGSDCDVSQLPMLFTAQENLQLAKTFLFLERVAVLLVVQELLRRKLKFEYSHVKTLLSLISETYIDILGAIQKVQPEFATPELLEVVSKLIPRKNVVIQPFFRHNESILRRINNLLKYSRSFLQFTEKMIQNIGHFSVNMAFFRLLEFFALHLVEMHINDRPDYSIAFLSTCPSPYLHKAATKPYTLVLDLDETLVHYNSKNSLGQFKIRPYCQQFIFQMSEHFEVGIFTCGMPDYADWVVSHLKGIQFKLYRHHAIQTATGFIKDLSRLGRDLKKVIMIDNLAHNFQLQKENGIQLKAWFGDPHDVALVDVMKVLKYVASQKPDDVRVCLREFGQMVTAEYAKQKQQKSKL